jgi:hypothetical protein
LNPRPRKICQQAHRFRPLQVCKPRTGQRRYPCRLR